MSGSPKPPSRFIAVNASAGLVRTIYSVSKKARKILVAADHPTARPERAAIVAIGVIAPAPANCGGGAGCAAGCGFLREFGNLRKRLPGCHPFAPAEISAEEIVHCCNPSRTSSSENVPRFVPPRLI